MAQYLPQQLGGYCLVCLFGEGGFADVYEAKYLYPQFCPKSSRHYNQYKRHVWYTKHISTLYA